MPTISVQALFPDALIRFQVQVVALGETVTPMELRLYMMGDGPVSPEYAEDPEGLVANPWRPKAWRMGRVKYFCEQFKARAAVEPILLEDDGAGGKRIFNGMHRLLGAAYAGVPEIAWRPPRP